MAPPPAAQATQAQALSEGQARYGHSVIDPPRAFPDAARFRDAMARLAGGVAIVACLDQGAPRGLLVSSLTSLSTEPPRMLFCVRKAAGSHGPLLRANRCSLSVLAEHDGEEAERFSTAERAAERFASPDWRLSPSQPPVYNGALIGLTGLISQRIDAGSHSMFILDIDAVTAGDAQPLVYFGRSFRALSPA
jgi:flavin reductase